jgi:hypothetical protein
MKNLTFLFLLLLSYPVFSQKLTYADFEPGKNRPSPNDFIEYVASNGESFKIGGKIKINKPSGQSNVFQYINKDVIGQTYPVDTDANGIVGEIIKFRVYGVSKKSGWEAVAVIKPNDGFRYQIELEQSIKFGEIESTILSREQAISKLKEAKDLLDLGLITPEEYEKIKNELTPIIMKD